MSSDGINISKYLLSAGSLIAFFGFLILLAITFSIIFDSFNVPTEDEIKRSYHAAIISPDSITGIFKSTDVHTVIFTYVTKEESADLFWEKMKAQLEGRGWEEFENTRDYCEFREIEEGTHRANFKLLRISLFSKTNEVLVAFIEDSQNKEGITFDTSSTAWVAEHIIWPKFWKQHKKMSSANEDK